MEIDAARTSLPIVAGWRDAVLEKALDAVVGINIKSEIIYWNAQAESVFGWSKDEAIGHEMAELIVPEALRRSHHSGMTHFLQTGNGAILNRRIEIRALRRSGQEFPVELTVIPVDTEGARVFYSFIRDISELKRTESERQSLLNLEQAARRRLELQYTITGILASADSIVVALEKVLAAVGESLGWDVGLYWQEEDGELRARSTWRRNNEISFLNFIADSKLRRYSKDEEGMAGVWKRAQPEWRAIHPEAKYHLPRAPFAAAAGFRTAFWFPLLKRDDGATHVVGLFEFMGRAESTRDPEMIRALDAASHQILQFIERLEDKAAIEKAARESRAINRLKDEFLASLSHELRTPLTAVLGFAEILRDEIRSLPPEDSIDCIDGIIRNARAQTDMISDLLDVSKIITGKVAFKPIEVSIEQIANESIDNFRATAISKGVQLRLDVDSVPKSSYADPVRIQQIFWNLISNAIKFTPHDGSVSMRVFTEDSCCVIEVQDSGAGIEAEFLPYVFDRFRQEDSSITRRFGGLGLGLSIARHLIEIHGGSIDARSGGKNLGSTFRVKLPIRIPTVVTPMITLRTESIDERVLVGRLILLVEDSDDSRLLIVRMLSKAGAVVHEVASAEDARRALRSKNFDLIISDIGMPGESGLEFMTALRATTDDPARAVPAIALTAYVRPEERDDILKAGFNAHVAKPVSREALISAIALTLRATKP